MGALRLKIDSPPAIWRMILTGCAVWTIIIISLSIAVYYAEQKSARHFAYLEAVASFEKDILYRRWAASHGGVYAPVTEKTPPNPYLAHITERDIASASGRALTLINPAYMTRQVHELGKQHSGVQGHITSLKPLRPENAPDPWEADALKKIDQGVHEISSVETICGKPYLRLIRPLLVEADCMRCHEHQGYRIGDIRGGISTAVPMEPFLAMTKREAFESILGLVLLWGMGITGLFFSGKSLVGYFEDRRRAEDAVREREEHLRVLFEHAPEAVIVFDVDRGRVVDVNANAARLCECSREDLLKSRPGDFYSPEQPDGIPAEKSMEEHIQRALRGEIVVFQRLVRTAAGKDILCEVHLLRVPSHDRKLLRASYLDITERKRIEAETLRLQKLEAISILAGGIAHDFNNMLTAAIGNIELAVMKTKPQDGSYPYLLQVKNILEQSRELGHRLLIFSKGGDPIRKPVRIADLVKDAVTSALAGSGIAYDLLCSDETLMADCDAGQIHQVIRNLLINAAEAMPDGGRVSIGCGVVSLDKESALSLPPGDYVMVSIQDTGVGIPEESIGKIFDPYFTTKDKYSRKGIGLGLTICHAIIKKHDGLITVESIPGRGTTFRVYLPAARKVHD